MDANERFHQLLKRDLSPLLRAEGFKGSGQTFWRKIDERIDVVNVQGSRGGGKCCINLATHYSFLPLEGGGLVKEPNKFKEYDCVFRARLHDSGESDHWWVYGRSDAEANVSVDNLIDLFKRRGPQFFARFEPFPQVFERITPAQLDVGDFTTMPTKMTLVRAALTLARIMRHLGRVEASRAFAEVGLRHAGSAVGLIPELERLCHAK